MNRIAALRTDPRATRVLLAVVVVALAIFPFFRDPLDGRMDDAIIALTYVLMALGLNLVVGFAGLLDLGYVAFFAFGALVAGWWASDFYRHTVSRVTPDGAETVVVEVEGQPSGLGWLPDGSLVVVSMKDHRVLRYADGTLSTHADLTEHCGGHLNDLVVTAQGHVFVGDFGFDLMGGGDAAAATLKRIDPDGTVSVAADGLQFPTAW